MATSLNQITLIGNIGKEDAVTKFFQNNTSVTTFSLATSESIKDKNGAYKEEVTWHSIVGWSLSEYLQNNLKSGVKVYIQGRLKKRVYKDSNNVDKTVWEVFGDRIMILDKLSTGQPSKLPNASKPQIEEDDFTGL